jgi:hypothetical protein
MSSPTTYPTASTPPPSASPEPEGRQGFLARLAQVREQQKLAAWVQQCFAKARSDRIRTERQWYLNLAMYAGRQNVEFKTLSSSPLGAQLVTPSAPPWRSRLVVNKIRPAVRREVAKLTAQRPNFEVVPATNSDTDASAARVGEQVLASLYTDLDIDHKLRMAVWWSSICGVAYLKDYWAPEQPDPRSRVTGCICVETVDPFHVFVPDLREQELDSQPWLIHATTRPREWVRAVYKADVAANVKATETLYEDVMRDGGSRAVDQVLCLEAWVRPGAHASLPDGGVLTLVGGKLVQLISGWSFRHGEYPFAKIDHVPMGRFYGDSVVTDLVPLQRELNRTRSQLVEQKNLLGRPKGLYASGSLDPNKITSEPGQWIPYQAGMPKPEFLPAPPMPGYVMEIMDRVVGDMDDISGQHEISRGGAPPQVTAATAISYLSEQDDTMLAYTVASIERAMGRLGRHLLSHVVQYWDTPRMVRVVGPDEAFEVQQFAGSALRGNTDVRVEAGSALPTSKTARQATLIDLYKLGAFGPPGSDPAAGQQLLATLGMRGVEKLLDEVLVDTRQAQRENTRLMAGEAFEANAYDTHPVHIRTHNRFRKGQAYEQAAAADPALAQRFAEHVASHERALLGAQALTEGGGAPDDQSTGQGGTLAPPGPADPSALPQPQGG